MSENLPPLPKVGPITYGRRADIEAYRTPLVGPYLPGLYDVAMWSTDQMHAYARTACAARDARIAELEAALKLADYIVTAFESDAVASDYYRDIHEFREALKGVTP